jgi:predicted nucleotidyltransferase
MRITKDQIVAGQPALKVRDFLRRYRLGEFTAPAAEEPLGLNAEAALDFLQGLNGLGLLDFRKEGPDGAEFWFHVTDQGQAFANASAAKPISRKTANRVLREFIERVQQVNSNMEYVYEVESVVLFGSMLGDKESLGDVDLAIELVPRESDDQQFQAKCQARRRIAEENGRRFRSIFDWAVWPTMEIFHFLKARCWSLSLHPLSEITDMKGVGYCVLRGNPDRLAAMVPGGTILPPPRIDSEVRI